MKSKKKNYLNIISFVILYSNNRKAYAHIINRSIKNTPYLLDVLIHKPQRYVSVTIHWL